VFDIEYRLPPPARHLDAIGDVKCAIGWVAENAARYAVDPARISLMGYSAGAHLALLAAYSMGNPLLPPSCSGKDVTIRSVINLYGPSDVKKHHGDSGSKDYVQRMMHAYIGGSPDELGNRYELISPIRHVTASSPPTLTLHGAADRVVPIEQAERLDQALARAGVQRETYFIPWADHGFDFIWGSFATQASRALVSAFLAKHG
jgi:acetyl esterase/lipase